MNKRKKNQNDFFSLFKSRISPEQCQVIHEASLEILERTGACLYLKQAVDLIRKAGGKVSGDNRVHIPASLVEKAMKTVPEEVVLFDRFGSPVMQIQGYRSFYCFRYACHSS